MFVAAQRLWTNLISFTESGMGAKRVKLIIQDIPKDFVRFVLELRTRNRHFSFTWSRAKVKNGTQICISYRYKSRQKTDFTRKFVFHTRYKE